MVGPSEPQSGRLEASGRRFGAHSALVVAQGLRFRRENESRSSPQSLRPQKLVSEAQTVTRVDGRSTQADRRRQRQRGPHGRPV